MRNRLLYSALALYAGLALGVDFIATPAKFMAPHLSLSVALEVGRATFHAFAWVEWALTVIFIVWAFLARPGKSWWFALTTATAILATESFWLLPLLDARVDIIVAGGQPAPSRQHQIYISLEAIKIAALLLGGLIAPAHLRTPSLGKLKDKLEDFAGPYPNSD